MAKLVGNVASMINIHKLNIFVIFPRLSSGEIFKIESRDLHYPNFH